MPGWLTAAATTSMVLTLDEVGSGCLVARAFLLTGRNCRRRRRCRLENREATRPEANKDLELVNVQMQSSLAAKYYEKGAIACLVL
jgi:hypothetical protein